MAVKQTVSHPKRKKIKRRIYSHVSYLAGGDRTVFCNNGTICKTTRRHIQNTVILLLIAMRKRSNLVQIYLQRGSEKKILNLR